MYFLFYAQGFDDALKFAYLKIENLILSRTKRAFEVKNTFENIFPSFTSALFRLKKQTNKNVMDTKPLTHLLKTLMCFSEIGNLVRNFFTLSCKVSML